VVVVVVVVNSGNLTIYHFFFSPQKNSVDVGNVADAIVAIAQSNDPRTYHNIYNLFLKKIISQILNERFSQIGRFEFQGASVFQQQQLFEALCEVIHRGDTKVLLFGNRDCSQKMLKHCV
jgi:hypothetical protein